MRSIWRTVDRDLLRDAAAMATAAGVVGMSFGAIAIAAGVGVPMTIALSSIVFAGGAQFLAVGIVAAGGPAAAAVAAGLLLNARHVPFGLAVADAVGRSWPMRLVGAHILIDESVAFATAQRDPRRARAAFWTSGLLLFVVWNLGTVAGVLAGRRIGDPAVFGVDAAFPAAMFALLLPNLRSWDGARVAIAGAAVAVATTPVLPAGLPALVALAGVLAAGRGPRPPQQATPAAAGFRIGGADSAGGADAAGGAEPTGTVAERAASTTPAAATGGADGADRVTGGSASSREARR